VCQTRKNYAGILAIPTSLPGPVKILFKPFDRTLNIKLDILSKWLLFFAHVQANELANKDETKYE
jgi:hypothetical protein